LPQRKIDRADHLSITNGQSTQVMNEIYNPNPTVLKTAGKRGTRGLSNLWDLDEAQPGGCGLCDDNSVSETIDQNEIFGRHLSFPVVAR